MMRRFLLVLSLLVANGAFSQAKSGLLLTTASASSDAGQRFHAYWIVRDGSQVQITEGNRLLTPRTSGWWELGSTVLKHATTEARNEVLWAGLVGTTHTKAHVMAFNPDEPCSDDINTYSLSWVGSDYAAVQHAYESTCGKNPVSGAEGFVVPLEDLTHEGQQLRPHVALRDVAGDVGADAMSLGAEIANARGTVITDAPESTLDENAWIVLRNRGRYQLLGMARDVRGREGSSYDIPLDPPKEVVGTNDLAVGWDDVLDRDPETLDAYSSPDGSFVVLVNPRSLTCYEVKDGKIGAKLTRVALSSPAVIAARWASDVERWNQELVPLFTGPAKK